MTTARTVRNLAASVLTASALVLTGCSSSTGDASVSQSQIEAKLKQESSISSVKTQLGATKFDAFISCVAKALKKDASGSDVDDYVHGKKDLTKISGNKSAAKKDSQTCVKAALGK